MRRMTLFAALALALMTPTAQAGPHRYEPVTAGAFLRARMDSITVG